MSWNLITNGLGTPTAGPLVTTGADLIVLSLIGTGSNLNPTDSKSNTWTPLTAQVGAFSSLIQLWYCFNPTVGSGHTFTDNDTTPAIAVQAWSGSASFDQEAGVSVPNFGTTVPPITPSQAGSLIISAGGNALIDPTTVDNGFTITDSISVNGGVNFSNCMCYLVQGAAASIDVTYIPATAAGDFSGVIASFKVAGGGTTNLSRLTLLGAG